jgi:hypothetical protein
MSNIRNRLGHHYMHAACGVAAVLIIAAFAFDIAPLAMLGALFCGAMMIGMVWMMVSMAGKGHH